MSDVVEATAPAKASIYENSKALAIRKDGAAAVPMPTNFAQMQDFASAMAKAGPMVGKPFRENPSACLAILTQSMRWGMDPYAVSQKAYIAAQNGDGPVGYEGQLVAAVVQALAPLQKRLRCEYEGAGDERQIRVIGFLVGEDEPFEYLSPPLKKLRPAKKDNGYLKGSQLWETDPDQQLWYYGVRAWSRKWTPDVIMGVYTPDEVVDGGSEKRAEGAAISMIEDEPVAQDAEFTPVDALLNKGPKENADPKAGAEALGDVGASGNSDRPKTTRAKKQAGSQPAADAAPKDDANRTQAGESEPKPAATDDASGQAEEDSAAEDEKLLAEIEGKLDPAKAISSRKIVNDHRGALNMIAAEGSDAHKARANKILTDWPAK